MLNMGIPAALTDFHCDADFLKICLPKLRKILVFGVTRLDGKLKLNRAYINTGFFKVFPRLIQVKLVLFAVLVMSPKTGRYKTVGKLSAILKHAVDHFFIRERISKRFAEILVAAGLLFAIKE